MTSNRGAGTIRTPGRRPRHDIKNRLAVTQGAGTIRTPGHIRQCISILIREQEPLTPDRAITLEVPRLHTLLTLATHFTIFGNMPLLTANITLELLPN